MGKLVVVVCLVLGAMFACGSPAPSSNDLTFFALDGTDGVIGPDNVTVIVPASEDLTNLVATFQTTGETVEVNGVVQESGVTPNNFSFPVTYTVIAGNGDRHDYVVTVTKEGSVTNDLVSFAFLDGPNGALTADVTATINGTQVAATVPTGTDVSALVATFTHTGASVNVGGAAQTSGTTANNFTSPVTYNVVAASGAVKAYTVTVTVAPSSAKDITAFSFLDANNTALTADVTATINGTAIAATVPFGTTVTALVATFTTTGASVRVGGMLQVSGTTPNTFASPVSYIVTAADGSMKTYTVTISIAAGNMKDITAFSFLDVNNAALSADVTATINGTAIAATVPFGTNVTALVATFTTTGASVAVGATPQISGTTPNNFTSPVTYVVTAADGSMQSYTVTITIAANPAKDITTFAFLDTTNPALTADVTATINGTAITATVPFGTTVSGLVATFTTTGASVRVGAMVQASGITPNDFTAALSYVVTAADGTMKTYTVTVTVAANPAKDITSFAFFDTTNPALSADVTATINGTAITATVPSGTNVTALVATFSTTGMSVAVGGTTQMSGITPNNFTSALTYVVTAADTTMKTYTVTVTIAPNDSKDITSFAFLDANNPALSADITATINGTAITASVPPGTNITALIATFTHTGASVAVSGATQSSGITANNFTSPVTYVVTAPDSSTKTYTVTVTFSRRFAMPRVRTSAAGATHPVTTVLRAQYGAIASPTSATVTIRMFNDLGVPIAGTSAICNPCTATLTGSNGSFVLDFATAAAAAGITTALDGYAVIDVGGDSARVVVSGTTETRQNNSTNTILDPAQVVEQRATGAHKLFVGPGQENNATTPATAGGVDVRLTFLNANGVAGGSGDISLRLFTTGGSVLMGISAVCAPCTFTVGGATGPARRDVTVHQLRAMANSSGVAGFLGVADVTGAGAADVIVMAEFELGSAAPTVTSRSLVPVNQERTGTATFQRFITTELTQSATFNYVESMQVASFTGLGGGGTLPSATVAHKVYDTGSGNPVIGNNGQPICNPSCGGTLGPGFLAETATLSNMSVPQGGVPPTTQSFAVTEVTGAAAAQVFSSKSMTSTGPTTLSRHITQPSPQGRTLVIPHIVEKIGFALNTPNTFDTTVFVTYTGGLPSGAGGTSGTVDLYLFDQTTGQPMQGATGVVCNPCTSTVTATPGSRKTSIRIEDRINSAGGFGAGGVNLGFGVVVVRGPDPDSVNITSTIVNAKSGPTDLSVFGVEPQPLAAPAL